MILDRGECEPLKGSVHATLGLLAGLCLAYNACAWIRRGERHLAVNVAVYGMLARWEWTVVRRHRHGR